MKTWTLKEAKSWLNENGFELKQTNSGSYDLFNRDNELVWESAGMDDDDDYETCIAIAFDIAYGEHDFMVIGGLE